MHADEQSPLGSTAILGVGSMGGAILAGLLSPGVKISLPVRVTTASESRAHMTSREGVIATSVERDPDANRAAVRGANVVILGVKPRFIRDVLHEVAADLEPDATVVSVAAGVTLDSMRALVPESVTVIRAMPNTPSHIGHGVTGLVAPSGTAEAKLETVAQLFSTVGQVVTVDTEEDLDRLTAVSGSGPAYVFLLIEEFTRAAERLGFSPDVAATLARGTFYGASALVRQTGDDPVELRRQVTSPHGTTERAIEQFQRSDLPAIFDRALDAAVRRSQEIAAES